MPTKVRKQVYIEPRHEQTLKRLSRLQGVTEAEIIRRALDQYMHAARLPARDVRAWEEERAFIEHLIALGPVAGRRTWQREDLHER